MVVSLEFCPSAAPCVALVRSRTLIIRRPLAAVVLGFLIAMSITILTTWGRTALGLASEADLIKPRPLTDFIWCPDALPWIMASLAGIAGILSLTADRSGSLVGALISLTTVPAAANAAVAIAYGVVHEAIGSAIQLSINFGAIVTGVLTLLVQRLWWSRVRSRRSIALPRPRDPTDL
jgi:uncharacterized hydrophobic protein (TIGR00271 family)